MKKDAREISGRRFLRYRGVALVWTAIVVLVLILFVGLSIDVGKLCLVHHQMQNASDAAALAGANLVRGDRLQARLQAQRIARENAAERKPVLLDLNVSNDPNGDIVIGWYNMDLQTFIPATSESDFVNAMAVNTVRSEARMASCSQPGIRHQSKTPSFWSVTATPTFGRLRCTLSSPGMATASYRGIFGPTARARDRFVPLAMTRHWT